MHWIKFPSPQILGAVVIEETGHKRGWPAHVKSRAGEGRNLHCEGDISPGRGVRGWVGPVVAVVSELKQLLDFIVPASDQSDLNPHRESEEILSG